MIIIKNAKISKAKHPYVEGPQRTFARNARKLAKEKGEKFYSTEKTCRKGHISKRHVNNGQCVECVKLIKLKLKGKYKEQEKRYHHSEKYKMNERKRKYGITEEQYNELFTKQKGVCAICSKKEISKLKQSLSVDHCKETSKIRGLLCHSCNLAIGYLKHNPELMYRAAFYCQ